MIMASGKRENEARGHGLGDLNEQVGSFSTRFIPKVFFFKKKCFITLHFFSVGFIFWNQEQLSKFIRMWMKLKLKNLFWFFAIKLFFFEIDYLF